MKNNDRYLISFLILIIVVVESLYNMENSIAYKLFVEKKDFEKNHIDLKEKFSSIREVSSDNLNENLSVSSTRSPSTSSTRSPYENYKNPYKECNFRDAEYIEKRYDWGDRICINQYGKIELVDETEKVLTLGYLNKVSPIGFGSSLVEYRLEGRYLIAYECPRKSDTLSCNGFGNRYTKAIRRF